MESIKATPPFSAYDRLKSVFYYSTSVKPLGLCGGNAAKTQPCVFGMMLQCSQKWPSIGQRCVSIL
jgi:hypothetical protein